MRRLLSPNSKPASSPSESRKNEAKMCKTLNDNKLGYVNKIQLISSQQIDANQAGKAGLLQERDLSGQESPEHTLNQN